MNDVFTIEELVSRGFSRSALEAECASGRLTAKRSGTTWSILAADFDSWHDSRAGQAISNGGTPASAPGPARQHHHAAAAGSTGEQWQALVSQLIASGTPASVARQHADARHPGGRMDLVHRAQADAKAHRDRERAASLARYTR